MSEVNAFYARASSLVVRTSPIPDMKNSNPSEPYMINALISRLPPLVFIKMTAPYINPPMPSIVRIAPNILLRFMVFAFVSMTIGQKASHELAVLDT